MELFFQKLIAKIGSIFFLPLTLLLSANPSPRLAPSLNPVTASMSPLATATPTPTPTPTPSPSPIPKPSFKPKPTPTLAASPSLEPSFIPLPPITSDQLDGWFTDYSRQYSVDRQKLWQIAVCESKLNPKAQNGLYGGLFQFSENTWRSTRTAMNLDADPQLRFNPEEAIKTAAFKIAVGGMISWPNCSQ